MTSEIWQQIDWWEAGLFAALMFAAWFGSWWLRHLLRKRLLRAQQAGKSSLRIEVWKSLLPLIRWGLVIAALAIGAGYFKLPEALAWWVNEILQGSFTLLAAYVAGSAVSVGLRHWARSSNDESLTRSRMTLAPVLSKGCRVLFFILAILLILENSGYNVAGLLAGLGIGGLAVALAGKETLANLFGSLTVLIDRPFEVGDVIRLGDVEGKVEKIGLRSTRVRTPDGYLVSAPNQNVTTLNVVNLSARSSRRQVFVLGLVYDLSAEQMQQAMQLIREVILAHPQTEDVWVHWKDFGESSLNVQVTYWSKQLEPKGFLDAIDELNAGIKKALDGAGFGFAFPTRTVVLQNGPMSTAMATA